MKKFAHITLLLILFLFLSCGSDESNDVTLPEDVGILTLELQFENDIYSTTIAGTTISIDNKLHFLASEVTIKSLKLSPNNTADKKIGDILLIGDSPIAITVKNDDNTISKTYTINLEKDFGLSLSPNFDLEQSSSYALQNSDVYVDGWQIDKTPNMEFINAYADFNGDGFTDVLLAGLIFKSTDYSPVFLYLGNGNGINADMCECGGECSNYSCDGFTKAIGILPEDFEGLQHPRKILTGDYNNDGKIDAFLIGHGYDDIPFPGESPILLLNTGTGFTSQKLNDLVGFYHGGSSADIDHDGDLDIVLAGSPSDITTLLLINDGNGDFSYNTERIDAYFLSQSQYYTTEFIDIDKDGFLDLIMAGHENEGAGTYILWGNSSGNYYKKMSTNLPTVPFFSIVVDIDAEDIDGDGDRDIILNRVSDDTNYGFYERYSIQILENSGDRTFSDQTSQKITDHEGTPWRLWVHLQDLNSDGILDIYYERDHFINLKWINDGTGSFNKVN